MSHAILSPSSAHRWLKCTPSAQLEALEPYSTSSYADEGTLAHRLAELLIKKQLGHITTPIYKNHLLAIQHDDLYTLEMADYCQNFADYVIEQFNTLGLDAMIFTEDRVDLSEFVPGGFGTVDIRIVASGVLHVIDLKYGKGVPVFADDNPQLKLYALGAVLEMEHIYNMADVVLTIYQPRLENISSYLLSVEELKAWGESELRPRAALAWEGKGDFVPGTHCQFCKIKHKCRALAEYNLATVREAFKNPALLEPDEIAEIVQGQKAFTDWIGSVADYAYDQAVNHGVTWPGLKLVEGRSNRVYTDEVRITEVLLAHGLSLEEIHTLKLKGITEMSKLLGKGDFERILGDFITKPAGKPVLVPEADKRAAFGAAERAKDAFKNF